MIPFVTCVYLLTVTSFFTVLSRQEMMSAEAIGVVGNEKFLGLSPLTCVREEYDKTTSSNNVNLVKVTYNRFFH